MLVIQAKEREREELDEAKVVMKRAFTLAMVDQAKEV